MKSIGPTAQEIVNRVTNSREASSRAASISALNLKVKEMLHQPAMNSTSRSSSILQAIVNKKPNENPYATGNFTEMPMMIKQNMR